jgi:hypothetical protein
MSWYEFGFVPGDTFKTQYFNTTVGLLSEWVIWVTEGTSTMTKTAHLVETDSSGIGRLWGLRIGDGTATGLNATEKLTIVGDGTQDVVTITSVATSLYALDIAAASTSANAVRITQTGAGQQALEVVGVGGAGVAAASFSGGSGTGVSATVTGANGAAVEGTASAGTAAGVYGTGANIGVRGDATTSSGSGGRFTSFATGSSSAEGADCRGLGDAVGARCSAVDGSAISASCTGEEDVIVALAAGDGAALRLDPQAAPTVDRAGQLWMNDVDTDIAQPMWCANATGLAQAQHYFWGGQTPLIADMAEDDSTQSFAQAVTNQTVLELVVPNPHAIAVQVRVSARVTAQNDSPAGTPIDTFSLHLFDATAATTMETDSFDLLSTTHRLGATIEELYTLPAATTTTLRLRISVGSSSDILNNVEISHAKLSVMTAVGYLV